MSNPETHTFVYNALDSVDASIRAMQLEEAGIEVMTVGSSGAISAGAVPVVEQLSVQIWVPNDQAAQATAIMRSYNEDHGDESTGEWTCTCGENNALTFQLCWKCQKDRPAS